MKYKRHVKSRGRHGAAALLLSVCLLLTGCNAGTQVQETEAPSGYDTGFTPAGTNTYDSADRAVVVSKSEEEKTVTLFNIPTGRNYTLQYDGTTHIKDRYEEAMSMAQIEPGDVVDVTFLKSRKMLRTLRLAPDVWTNTAADNYSINQNGKGLLVAKDQYQLADNVMVVSEGRQASLEDINVCDKLLLRGIDRTIYSITVENGHGYLRLANEEYFVGGWIEVGQSLIKRVEEEMLLVVPEGSHQVLISHKGTSGIKNITVQRGQEVMLDVGDLKGEETKRGSVIFALNPVTASVYIDGDKADTEKAVEMDYGIHQLIVRAEGYKTISRYLKVGQPYATLDIELEKEESVSDNSLSDNSLDFPAGGQVVDASGGSRIYITAPEGAEVYYDSNYAGVVPVDIKKEEGIHVITLRKTGCQTRSFTMQVDGEDKDISWAFSELEVLQ